MVVWFQARDNFDYCHSNLKKWGSLQKWSKMKIVISLSLSKSVSVSVLWTAFEFYFTICKPFKRLSLTLCLKHISLMKLYRLLKLISSVYVILVVDTFFSLNERFQDSAAKVRNQQKLTKAESLKDTTDFSEGKAFLNGPNRFCWRRNLRRDVNHSNFAFDLFPTFQRFLLAIENFGRVLRVCIWFITNRCTIHYGLVI